MFIFAGDKGEDWFPIEITVPYHSTYYLTLKATKGLGPLSDIAVDDLQVANSEGRCTESGI